MIVIRKATVKDATTIVEIGKTSFIQSHGNSAPAEDIDAYLARKYTPDVVSKELEIPENIFHLISFNETVAGYSKIAFNVTNESIPAQNVSCLDRLYLLKDFYDMKLGATLLETNINMSRQSGQAGMWLYTWTENERAISFYSRAGFEIIGNFDFNISQRHSNPNYLMYLDYRTSGRL